MPQGSGPVLLVEDSPSDAARLRALLEEVAAGPSVHVTTVAAALPIIARGDVAVVLLDLELSDAVGMEGLMRVRHHYDGPIVVLTGQEESAAGPSSVRHGAQEFLGKADLDQTSLSRALRYARERHEHELAQDRAQRRLRRYIRAVAHDLRTPLTTVQGFADLIVQEQLEAPGDGSSAGPYAERILASSVRLGRMIDQLLVDADLVQEVEDDVDLSAVAHRTAADLAEELERADAELVVGALPTIRGRRAALQAMFASLFANSIEHAVVDKPRVEVWAEAAPDGGWDIVVQDSGTNVDDEILAGGQPVEAPRMRNRPDGRGFGLRTVAMVVEEHDGQTWLRRSPTGGLRVVLHLPQGRAASVWP